MMLRNGKRLISYSEEQNKKKKNNRANFTKIDDDSSRPYLPEELILENILIRLPARDLAICSCVSKFWYNSILKDSRFASSHSVQNKNRLNLVFNLLNVPITDWDHAYLLSLEEEEKKDKDDNFLLNYRLLWPLHYPGKYELVLVGYCNGLVCTKQQGTAAGDKGVISVINPMRGETLALSYSTPTSSAGGRCIDLCHGFVFDSLSEEYKVVLIYTTTTSTISVSGDQEFVCLVLTLGGSYSRKVIVISTAQISPPPGLPYPFPSPMVTTSRVTAATLYGGDLVWWITNTTPSNNNKIDMLLSFDIHNQKIHFIRLPSECSPTPTTRDEHQCLVVDHHLLEFKGYLCVARSEKLMIRNNSHHPHHHHRRRSRHHHCKCSKRSFCCSDFKVHLFILKDKINQVWMKAETFNLQIKEEGLHPAPLCCYFDTATNTNTTPPTRILSFYDQLLLYWFDGEYLLLYNLQLKHLKMVKCASSSNKQVRDIFVTKMKKGIRPGRCIGDDDNFIPPYMDYQLHAQAENILSLKTFIPEGETVKFHDFLQSVVENGGKAPGGVVCTATELVQMHPFFY